METSPFPAPLEARFQLNPNDAKAFEALAKSGAGANASQRLFRSMLALFVLMAVASVVFKASLGPANPPRVVQANSGSVWLSLVSLLAPVALFAVFFFFILKANKKEQAARPAFQEPSTVSLNATGMAHHCGAFTNGIEWRGFTRVAVSNDHLALFTSATEGYVVPRRAFDAPDDWQRFVGFARQNWEQTRPPVPPIANA